MTDMNVPDYLGRVLDRRRRPVGTCFQLAPGVFITAWHVLKDAGAEAAEFVVTLDRLPSSSPLSVAARVLRADPRHDIAVLKADSAFPASIAGITATGQIAPQTSVQVLGVSNIDDPGHEYRYIPAVGTWQGPALRDKEIHLGAMECKNIARGMSGAPVLRLSDNMVLGVVSGRYNSADGWLGGTVWVARTEDLKSLLGAAAPISRRKAVAIGTALLGTTISAAAVSDLSNSHRHDTPQPPDSTSKTETTALQAVTTGLDLDRRPGVVSADGFLNVLINDEVGGIRAIRSRDSVKWEALKLITNSFLCRNPSVANLGEAVHVVAAGLDGSIRWITADTTSWHPASTIAPSGTADSEVHIIAHRNLLWGFTYARDAILTSTSDGEDWSDWSQIGRVANPAGQITPAIYDGGLHLFSRDKDGRVWHTTYDDRTWGDVAPIQGLPISREHAVISSDRELSLFVRDSGGRVWHGDYFDGRISGRTRIDEIPAAIRGPVIGEFHDRRVLFTADRFAGVQVSFEQERGWEKSRRIGGIPLAGAPVASFFHDALVVLVIDEAGTTWSSTYRDGRWHPFVHVA